MLTRVFERLLSVGHFDFWLVYMMAIDILSAASFAGASLDTHVSNGETLS